MNASNICHLFLIIFSISLIVTSNAFNFTLPDIPASAPRPSENATRGPWDGFKNFTGCHAGQNPDGLSKLKQYFNDFGYIPKGGNFTDDFDEEFESALKTYQKNFNLNQTGMLDNSTLNQIQRPRCGNADIVNGTSTMNSGKTSTYNKTSHFHNVGHYTFFQGQPRWSKDELSYAFLSDNNLSNETKAVFTRAFARWAEVIPMNFTETDNYDFADIRIGFYQGDHGDGEPFDGVLGTLAHSFSPESGRTHYDGAENWVVSGDIESLSSTSAVDLESVAIHEIGHLLGLGHTSDASAIMYPTISTGERKVELASDDIEGVQVLYGSNPNYNGTSSLTTDEEKNEVSNGFHVKVTSVWSMVGLLVVGLYLQIFLNYII